MLWPFRIICDLFSISLTWYFVFQVLQGYLEFLLVFFKKGNYEIFRHKQTRVYTRTAGDTMVKLFVKLKRPLDQHLTFKHPMLHIEFSNQIYQRRLNDLITVEQ